MKDFLKNVSKLLIVATVGFAMNNVASGDSEESLEGFLSPEEIMHQHDGGKEEHKQEPVAEHLEEDTGCPDCHS